jgi:hypothetical protein
VRMKPHVFCFDLPLSDALYQRASPSGELNVSAYSGLRWWIAPDVRCRMVPSSART